jgi:hypothetical protein
MIKNTGLPDEEVLEFDENMKKLCKWFRKEFTPDQKAIIADKLKSIPDRALTWVIDQIITMEKFFPTIGKIFSYYYRWIESHPEENKEVKAIECNECNSSGWITFRRMGKDGVMHRDEALCAKCENWKRFTNNPKQFWITDRYGVLQAGHEMFFTSDKQEMAGVKIVGKVQQKIDFAKHQFGIESEPEDIPF